MDRELADDRDAGVLCSPEAIANRRKSNNGGPAPERLALDAVADGSQRR